MRDYVRIAKNYANSAIKDKARKRHGYYLQQAAKRFLKDLKRAKQKSCPFMFDPWHANDVCDFIEKLPHVEGTWDTPTLTLHRSHVFFLVQLFGFRKKEAIQHEDWGEFHPRRFSSALFCIARKNAKSTLAAAILIYCECCEPEDGAQVISAATTYTQASIIFNIAKRMVEKTPDLREAFGLETWAKSISRVETGASFKPVHAKASTQDGLNPSHIGLDEIHAHKSPDLLNVLTSAAGARKNPLFLFTTTEGYLNPGPWADLRSFAHKILEGVLGNDADHFLALIFSVDVQNENLGIKKDDDEFDENSWRKANPLMDVNPVLLTEIRKQALEAKQMPSTMAEFRIKRLNKQSSTADGAINLAKLKRCATPVDLKMLEGHPCWGGLDLASTGDIAVFRIVWEVDGVIYTHAVRWVPEEAVKFRTERKAVNYAGWVERGLLKQTEGDSIDYEVIEKDILELNDRFSFVMTGYDSWNARDLVARLVKQGMKLVEFVQGTKSYHPAMQAFEVAYHKKKFAYGKDPVLEWMASNLVAKTDQNLSQAPDKKRSADKIDDMAALYMAIGVMQVNKPKRRKSIYEQGEL